MKRKNLWIIVLVVAMALIAGCGKKEEENVTTEESSVSQESGTEESVEETSSEESLEGKVKSYLTGQWIDESIGNRRPVAVMLNNIKQAVPQSGIDQAGIIYEAPVEGGITRLMGIFEDYDDLDKIGSVRSARTYYVYFALEFDAFYVHFGQAKFAEPILENERTNNLSGLASESSAVFYRTTDRKAPHNAYTSAEGIQKGIDLKGYRTEYEDGYTGHYQFAEDGEEIDPVSYTHLDVYKRQELCGGTHVQNTASITAFKIISETGIAAGVRRIEALTAEGVFRYYNEIENELNSATKAAKTEGAMLAKKIESMMEEIKTLHHENEKLKNKLAKDAMGDVMNQVVNVKDVKILAVKVNNLDMNGLRNLGDQLKDKLGQGVVVLASETEGRVMLLAMVTEEAMKKGAHAGNLIKAIAGCVGGGGGGRPNMAQAGGKLSLIHIF